MRGGNRQTRRQLDKMGLQMDEMPDVREVIIKTDEKEITLPKPSVTKMNTKNEGVMYMIAADSFEEREVEAPAFSENDVSMVCARTGVDAERAKEALTESNGELARAIMMLETS